MRSQSFSDWLLEIEYSLEVYGVDVVVDIVVKEDLRSPTNERSVDYLQFPLAVSPRHSMEEY